MIKSIKHRGLKRFTTRGDSSKLPIQNTARVRRIILALDAAFEPESLDLPGFRFHELKGERKGTYSVSVSGNWRLTFKWDDGAIDVDLEDYH